MAVRWQVFILYVLFGSFMGFVNGKKNRLSPALFKVWNLKFSDLVVISKNTAVVYFFSANQHLCYPNLKDDVIIKNCTCGRFRFLT